MTPSDQSADQQLTRRQLREIRMTGATPIVTAEAAAEALAQSAPTPEPAENAETAPAVEQAAPQEVTPVVETPAEPPLHLPRAAEPIAETPAPIADAAVDLGVRARTRRQARAQERIRTNSIPVLTPEAATPPASEDEPPVTTQAPSEATPAATDSAPAVSEAEPVVPDAAPAVSEAEPVVPEAAPAVSEAEPVVPESEPVAEVEPVVPESAPAVPETEPAAEAEPVVSESAQAVPEAESVTMDAESAADAEDAQSQWAPRAATGAASIPMSDPAEASDSSLSAATTAAADEAPVVRADFGSEMLSQAESFDDLLVRSSTSSGSAGSASMLILPVDVSLSPLTAPVTSTGQVILTGTFALPEGLGSQGHAPGVADGKDVDAVLIDGELAPQSSPTPIAATAAVSQAKTPVEMIRPPSPEKSSKLVVALAITAGLLSLAAIGFTIYVVTTGKF
ncbi:hypothetical protein [Microbacterium sp. NC79]|uniref:hypothetical protein n=1 Tax=Microbacterium sp. NC79 TaxID=2851009 RepID=UPI001C2CC1F4|nr:hypothetical protein [Microbacterium sp. NC79]MBV0894785.1 hypothetical protein [Microbacterium sp. NC79]